MTDLPHLMVAPNGARRTKADHPALPMALPEIVETARDCAAAGADGLHLHLRDGEGCHVLDAGLYREAFAELRLTVPQMALQIRPRRRGLMLPRINARWRWSRGRAWFRSRYVKWFRTPKMLWRGRSIWNATHGIFSCNISCMTRRTLISWRGCCPMSCSMTRACN